MSLLVGDKRLDDPARPYIIAEASGNHMQDKNKAYALILAAAEAGADAIKFQTFTPEEIASDIIIPRGHDAEHDAWLSLHGARTLQDIFAKGGLPRSWHLDLKSFALDKGLTFLSTPFSISAARFLVEDIEVPALKIASGDLTYTPLLEYAASTDLPLLLSTGAATCNEIMELILREGILNRHYIDKNLVVFHCVSVYPCAQRFTNLRAIRTLRSVFPRMVLGWSDHTLSSVTVPVLAVSMGATVIEKHLRLQDKDGIDAGHSLNPRDFATMVKTVRKMPEILGNGAKTPQEGEMHDRLWARRSPEDWLRPTEEARQGRWE